MTYLWFVLQAAPPLIALWLHRKKTKEIYFTKDTAMKTLGDLTIMSFFITLLLYFVMYLNDPNETVVLDIIHGGRLTEVGFVFKHAVISLVGAILVGNCYSLDVKKMMTV